ncbi:MAG: DUF2169 domain-containing protein [Polyangiaceae bacterium]|nr:DUF2169 domain-containing protein [Polyangiaceae bacterium]
MRVGSILWLPPAGTCALTVVCKATFRLAPDVSPLADDQVEVFETDEYLAGNEAGSLIRATDLVPFKRQPEVLLTGHVYAPKGVHVGQLVARMTVAEVDKAIEVTGDRHFKLDGTLSHPARFAKMPLVWERAAGGGDSANPVGVLTGPDAAPDGWGRVAVPNLVSQGRIVNDRSEVIAPACFGPLGPLWPARLHRLHRHAVSFSPHAWHARPLPSDFDGAYFNAAPQDQLVHELLGNERITLENLHPQHALLSTKLAGVTPRAHADFGNAGTFEVPLVCDTLWIDTDRAVATVTFRGSMSLDYPEREGWVVVTMEGHEHVYASPADGYTAYAPEARDGVYTSGSGPLDAWMGRVSDVNETMSFEGADEKSEAALLPAALPFAEQEAAFESAPMGDFDDEVTYAGDRAVRTPSAAAVPKVPTGPRLERFNCVHPHRRPRALKISILRQR